MIDAKDLVNAWENIKSCTDCAETCHQKVFIRGKIPAKILIVGVNPGEEEVRQGQPFVGPSGQMLDELLVESGLDVYPTAVSNAVFCFTLNESKLPAEAYINCRQHSSKVIQILKPKYVILMGKKPFQVLFGNMKLWELNKSYYSEEFGDMMFFTSYHPSYALRRSTERMTILNTFNLIKQTIQHMETNANDRTF